MKFATANLVGVALDYAVAAALNARFSEARSINLMGFGGGYWVQRQNDVDSPYTHRFSPSDDWRQAGEIFDASGISVCRFHDTTHNVQDKERWFASPMNSDFGDEYTTLGPDMRTAGLRCFVLSVFGKEVDLPDILQEASGS